MPILVMTARGEVEHQGKVWRSEPLPAKELLRVGGYDFHDPALVEIARLAEEHSSMMALTYLATASATSMIAVLTAAGYMGINSASPGITGANEIAANSASTYTQSTRPSIGWAAFSTDHQTSNTTQTYTMGASWTPAAIPYFSLWSLNAAGTYYTGGATTGLSGNIPASANVTFTSAVTLTIAG